MLTNLVKAHCTYHNIFGHYNPYGTSKCSTYSAEFESRKGSICLMSHIVLVTGYRYIVLHVVKALCGLFGTKFWTVVKWRCQRGGLPSTQIHETLKADPTGHERIIPHHLYKIKVLRPQRYWPICRSRNL